jgi:hypothetical protein
MAYFKYHRYLNKSDHNVFDTLYEPGTTTPYSGIYRCEVCGKEDTSIKGKLLAPQYHHQHASGQEPIRWRLVVGNQPDPNK